MLYNRTEIAPRTRADAEDVNQETAKIVAAINALETLINNLLIDAGAARFMWLAFADSDDGTVNFSHDADNRRFIGIAVNKLTDVPSNFAVDYTWIRFQGGDSRSLTLTITGDVFEFDQNGNSLGLGQISAQAIGTNLLTAVTFTAFNDTGNAVTLDADPDGDANVKVLTVANFGTSQWVRIIASAHDGTYTDSRQVIRHVTTLSFNPRGAYSATTQYAYYDTVTFNGGTYYALQATLGNAPSGTDQDTAYWAVIAAPGGSGAAPGAPYTTTIDLVTTASTVNLRALADAAGYDGVSDATILFRVPNAVTITGLHNSGRGIDTGSWPSDVTLNLDLEIQNGGIVRGGGGDGGHGGNFAGSGDAGTNGGDAIYCQADIDVTIDVGGTVSGGGGAGGGGNGTRAGPVGEPFYYGGGGGGGGFPNGVGGTGGTGDADDGVNGGNGTPGGLKFGAGGQGGGSGIGHNGKSGGVEASAGVAASSSGLPGAGGYAVRKNGHTVNVTNNGTMQGTAA
jgi:hypothetical protein